MVLSRIDINRLKVSGEVHRDRPSELRPCCTGITQLVHIVLAPARYGGIRKDGTSVIFTHSDDTGFSNPWKIILRIEAVTDSVTIKVGWNTACIESIGLTTDFFHASPTIAISVNVDACTCISNLVEDIQVIWCTTELEM